MQKETYSCMPTSVEGYCKYIEYLKANGKQQVLLQNFEGKPLSNDEAIEYLDKLKSIGYSAIPSCSNHNEHGYCKGHTEEEVVK